MIDLSKMESFVLSGLLAVELIDHLQARRSSRENAQPERLRDVRLVVGLIAGGSRAQFLADLRWHVRTMRGANSQK